MFGKVSAYSNYIVNALKVYNTQRFPAKIFPMWTSAVVGISFAIFYQRMYWKISKKMIECDKYANKK